jgi:hypothetical protein
MTARLRTKDNRHSLCARPSAAGHTVSGISDRLSPMDIRVLETFAAGHTVSNYSSEQL